MSPLIRAMLNRGRGDLDPWLAGMNGLALAFLVTALGVGTPEADASRLLTEPDPTLPDNSTNSMVVELAAPPEVSAEARVPPETPSPGQVMTLPMNLATPPPAQIWRELPELIDPVEVREPGRRPEPRPGPAAARPNPDPLRRTAVVPAPAGSPAGSQNEVAAPASAIGGGRGSNPQPPYPAFARRDRLQGTVIVSITVKNGAVGSVRVVSSSGSTSLDEYAVSHVQRRWKWPAGTSQTFTQPFRFVLK
ncbi:MAG: TonB family protein [Verrucomicrobiota bacterium]